VVCVTINYRVGPDGFLFVNDGLANLGLLDQVAALEWVRDNISAFGGDPDNVTIFGESAGASSVAMLCAMPRAAGLFRRAIVESGGLQHLSPAPIALRINRIFAEKLGVAPTREAIAALSIERTLEGQAKLREEIAASPDPRLWGEVALTSLPWQPTMDGDVIPADPLVTIASGAAGSIDLMVGTNTDETRLFMLPVIDTATESDLAGLVASFGLPVEPTLATYRALHPGASAGDLVSAVMTDWGWRIPAVRLADAHAMSPGPSRTFMYEFAWRSPQFGGLLGAAHAVEIPFVFDTLGNRTEHIIGTEPPQSLADTMHRGWVEFARHGDPGWPEYDLSRRATMRFDLDSAVVDDPLTRERALWEGMR
jgi:carboxylesterase 2/para-nitrobenzyl esterase